MIRSNVILIRSYKSLITNYEARGYVPPLPRVAGKTDVLGFRSVGLSRDEYIGNVNLTLTDKTTNSPVYYVIVKAKNGAGKESNVASSRWERHA